MARLLALLVSTAEAARCLGISRERVRQLLENGMLAGFPIEGHSRARYVDLKGEGTQQDRILVTMQEVAQRAGVTPATVRTWIDKQRLEGFRVAGDKRIYIALE